MATLDLAAHAAGPGDAAEGFGEVESRGQPGNVDSRRWLGLVSIALGQLMLALDATIMNVALPSVERALDFSAAVRPWVVSAYLLPFALLLLPGGRFADALGQKRVFSISLLGFALASALGGAARAWPVLVLARALQGAFAAALAPSALSLVAVGFPHPRERARAFGVYGAVAASGGALGLVLGGLLVRAASWRACLYVNLPIAALAAIGVSATLPASMRMARREPLLESLRTLLSDGVRRRLISVAALAVAAMAGLFLLLTYYFQSLRGFSALDTGLAFLPLSLGGMLGSSQIARRLMPVVAPRLLIAGALGVAALGMSLLGRAGLDSSYTLHLGPTLLLVGAGIGAAMMPCFSLATLGVEPWHAGLASAMIATAQQLGGALGAATLNGVAARVSASASGADGAAANLHGYGVAAAVGAGFLIVAAVVAAGIGQAAVPRSPAHHD